MWGTIRVSLYDPLFLVSICCPFFLGWLVTSSLQHIGRCPSHERAHWINRYTSREVLSLLKCCVTFDSTSHDTSYFSASKLVGVQELWWSLTGQGDLYSEGTQVASEVIEPFASCNALMIVSLIYLVFVTLFLSSFSLIPINHLLSCCLDYLYQLHQ